MKERISNWTRTYGLATSLIVLLAILAIGLASRAQSTGYRWTQNGLVVAGNGTVCFEASYNAGPDVCIERTAAGHLALVSGTLGTDPDEYGQATLSGGTKTITFSTAYTVAPIAVCTDTSATATVVGCHTTTTTLVINGTGTDVINYEIVPNPN